MAKHKYKYTGKEEVNISYVGTYTHGDIVEVDEAIKHPDFEVVHEEKSKSQDKREEVLKKGEDK